MSADSTCTINGYGDRVWRNSAGQIHRTDGPAVEWEDGHKHWYVNGMRHREDGPAIESRTGMYKEWWLDDQKYSEEQYNIEMSKRKEAAMIEFTAEQLRKIVEEDKCLFCECADLSVVDKAYVGVEEIHSVVCNSCGKEWDEVYTLTEVRVYD